MIYGVSGGFLLAWSVADVISAELGHSRDAEEVRGKFLERKLNRPKGVDLVGQGGFEPPTT